MTFPFPLLLLFLILSLARLCLLYWYHTCPVQWRTVTRNTAVQRLLKPRSPDDCPACRLASSLSPVEGPATPPVRPWSEIKSRRGAPKRISTQVFACPNHKCLYFGITEAHIHALVGDGKQGHAEQIQTFRGPACHITFSARRCTPLYRLIPTCVPSGILGETMEEGKKTCFGNESHTSGSSFSTGRSQTSHETGPTLLGSRTLEDHLPRLDCPAQSRSDRQRYGRVSHDGAPRHVHLQPLGAGCN